MGVQSLFCWIWRLLSHQRCAGWLRGWASAGGCWWLDGLMADGTPRLRILSGLRLRRGLASRHLRSTPLLQKQSQPVSWASAVHSDRKEEKKPAEGRRRALWRPVLVVGSFLKRIGIKLVKESILNRVAYRTPDRQREAFWNRVAYRKLDRQREPFWIS